MVFQSILKGVMKDIIGVAFAFIPRGLGDRKVVLNAYNIITCISGELWFPIDYFDPLFAPEAYIRNSCEFVHRGTDEFTILYNVFMFQGIRDVICNLSVT